MYSPSGGLGCQPCDCHAVGSPSSECNGDTGQCLCQENVMGRRCDQCIENFAGMDELGCKGEPLSQWVLSYYCQKVLALIKICWFGSRSRRPLQKHIS